MILLKDVSYEWEDGRTALKNINLEIKKGEFVLISGKSGSGKSTLGSVMNGLIPHYYKGKMQGEAFASGKDISKLLLHEVGHIVGTVFQDPRSQFFTTTTDEEIAFGLQTICKSRDEIKQRVEEVYEELDIEELKGKSVFELSSGQKQKIAIASIYAMNPKVLILDEPTSSLDDQEVEKLFKLMKDLKSRGVGIIFVTHFLDQVYEVCDKITVLRDGALVGEYEIKDLPRVKLVSKMLGKELDDVAEIKDDSIVYKAKTDIPVFEAEGLQSNAGIKPFNFYIKKGEVNGFTGLLGSGRSECVRAIFGADKVIRGTVKKNGKAVKITKPIDAMRQGIAYLPEDRKRDGIIGDLSVRDNIILALQVMKGFFRPFSKAEANKFAEEYIKLLSIKTASADTPIKSLSGGNQQKVILARWLLTKPEYLILDEPTRGIDIGTKIDIQKLVLKLASEGMSVTFISSETDEMLRTCSRLIVMRDRKVVGELSDKELSQSMIMNTIAGGEK